MSQPLLDIYATLTEFTSNTQLMVRIILISGLQDHRFEPIFILNFIIAIAILGKKSQTARNMGFKT